MTEQEDNPMEQVKAPADETVNLAPPTEDQDRYLSGLNDKIKQGLPDRVVSKPLTRWNEAYKEFPRFVMEYLVSRYVNPDEPVPGQSKIDRILTEHYTESAKKELIKSRIKENGEYLLLGQLSVRLDQGKDHYWADVPALGDDHVRVAPKVLAQYRDALMTSGAWGTMTIAYDATYELGRRKYPFYIREFMPFQVILREGSIDEYAAKRRQFTEDEWIDLLVQSIGFNPVRFDRRTKWLMLLRLVPFVESNYNLIELGPRETGKTYTYRNTSAKSFVISGGKATTPTLFYNKATRKLGVVGVKHVVFFDEIANTRFDDPESSISMLKDYMQTGKFTRGDQEFSAQCSIVMGGNIDTDLRRKVPSGKYEHLFAVLPAELQDIAFLDRIHGYMPGWEMPKIRPENYATGYGFMTDYLAEVFAELRRRNFQTFVSAAFDFGSMTGRNQDAIKKTAAGMLKLLHPDLRVEDAKPEMLEPVIAFAVEIRKRVVDQLAVMKPEEFGGTKYDYELVR